MIRVLIVDDSAFVRKALSRMLGGADDIEVVGTRSTARTASRRCSCCGRTW